MTRTPSHHGKDWTQKDDALLRRLAVENTPTRVMGLKLGRTPASVQQRASQIGQSLRPTNQRPNKPGKGR